MHSFDTERLPRGAQSNTMTMKYTTYYTIAGTFVLLLCGLLFASCDMVNGDFLDRSAKGGVSENVLVGKDADGADALLLGAYDALDGMGNGWTLGGGNPWAAAPDNWVYGTVAGGLAHKGSTEGDQAPILTIARHQHLASNGFFNDLWKANFEGVARANSVLNLLTQIEDISESERNRIAGEARFLRGHFYFNLKKNFGNVPWIDETTEDLKQPNTGEGHPDIWQKIEEDFQFAMDNLPEVQSDVGRANSWAAASYLAKAHLYQEDWQNAADLFDTVIQQGVNSSGESYALMPNFQDMFDPDKENNSETVFDVQQNQPQGTLWDGGSLSSRYGDILNYPHSPSPFTCCGFFQPTLWFVNSFRVDANGLPLSFDPASGTSVKHDQGVAATAPFTVGDGPVDPRLDWSVGRRGIPYKDWGPHPGNLWVREQPSGGPFHGLKHVGWSKSDPAIPSLPPLNYHVIRFADVLLMAAEAHAELNNLPQALDYVNRVRNRAASPTGQVTNDLNTAGALAVVGSEAEMLATDPGDFDWVVRTDLNSTFVFLGDDPSDISSWNEYDLPDYDVQPYPSFASQEDALEKIRFERKLELGLEGHRYYDLVRWGIADQVLDDYYSFETNNLVQDVRGGDFTPNKNEVYPIPQRQIDLSTKDGQPTLQQNPGY